MSRGRPLLDTDAPVDGLAIGEPLGRRVGQFTHLSVRRRSTAKPQNAPTATDNSDGPSIRVGEVLRVPPGSGRHRDMTPDDPDDHAEPAAVASYATEGEAEVAHAKLRAYGLEAALDDQIEGGSVPIEGEEGVVVAVRGDDAADARDILDEEAAESPEM